MKSDVLVDNFYRTNTFSLFQNFCLLPYFRFKVDGVPALLVYKEGQIIGNFVRITDELGDEFYEGDVENFLVEHGILLDRFCVPEIIRQGRQHEENDDGGSDWSLE